MSERVPSGEAFDAACATTSAAVRRRFAETLARRAAAHDGAVRQILNERLARLATVRDDEAAVTGSDHDHTPGRTFAPSPLAALVERLAGRAPALSGAPASTATTQANGRDISPPPATLDFFRRTWTRLNVDQRLAQSRALLPEKAGPLNSHHLVHRALTLMHERSPDYLERFVAQVEALLWLEQVNDGGLANLSPSVTTPVITPNTTPNTTPKRAARGRAG